MISKKVANILLAMAERYVASLPEEERLQYPTFNAILKERIPSESMQTTDCTKS
jgi:hypothetical protein